MSNKEKQQQEEIRMQILLHEMIEATISTFNKAQSASEALGLLAAYTQSVAVTITVGSGIPVVDNINVLLRKIATIKDLDKLEATSKATRQAINAREKMKASIVDMNGNPLK